MCDRIRKRLQNMTIKKLKFTFLPALPLLLLLLALATVFLFGGDREQFYRSGAHGNGNHNYTSSQNMAVAANLSPDHGFLMFIRRQIAAGTTSYVPYSRFPIGSYVLVKLAILPFPDDMAAQTYAARLVMLSFFAAAAVLAYLAFARLLANRWIALTATLLAFSSYNCLYYSDMVSPEVAALFGLWLAFHGMVVFVQDGRFRQLLVKACAAILLGWHVVPAILLFAGLGMAKELLQADTSPPHLPPPRIRSVRSAPSCLPAVTSGSAPSLRSSAH